MIDDTADAICRDDSGTRPANFLVMMLATLVQDKFTLTDEQIEAIPVDLEKLELEELRLLVQQILHFDTLNGLKQWIAGHQPT